MYNKAKQKKTNQKKSDDRTQDNFTWLQKKKRIKLMKIKKENERKYQSGKLNKCDALCSDPVMFQTLRILSLGRALHCLSLLIYFIH